jgi:Zn-dependent membrane protease YugP
MLLDVDYILLGLPGLLTSVFAWRKVSSVRGRASRAPASAGLTGAEAALRVMKVAGIEEVPIEPAAGPLANHYDASRCRLRLSEEVYFGRSLAALGIAAHEAGHVLQAESQSPWALVTRVLVPTADLGSILSWLLLLAGITLGLFRLTVWGLAIFSLSVLLQLLNLGAELDATRRARKSLEQSGVLCAAEESMLSQLQVAWIWTHVAAVLTGFPAFVTSLLGSIRRSWQAMI